MKTHALTIKIRAKRPKNVRNCERSASRRWRQRARARSPSCAGQAYATLAAVEGWVAHVAAGYEIDYVFGYVGGVVADAFQIFGD